MPSGVLDIIEKAEYMSILNEEPQITFFRTIFKRYTPFSTQYVVEPASSSVDASDFTSTLSKAGDLVYRCFLRVKVSSKSQPIREPSDASWAVDSTVWNTFQQYDFLHSLESEDTITFMKKYKAFMTALGITDVLQTISNNILEMLEIYGNQVVYRAYQFLDFLGLVERLSSIYSNSGNLSINVIQAYSTHPIHSLLVLQGASTTLTQLASPVLSSQLLPFLFENYYVEIGGNQVCSYSPHYFNAASQLRESYNVSEYTQMTESSSYSYIPLMFFFSEYNTLALPVCALRFHDVKLGVVASNYPFLTTSWSIESVDFIVQYVYLSDRERLKFTTANLEYLVHQIQEDVVSIDSNKFDIVHELTFTRPSIELIWFVVGYDISGNFDVTYTNSIQECEITLGGDSVGTETYSTYYRLVQPWSYHTHVPKNVYMFSFALDTESYQPSGSLNIGKIPHAYIKVTLSPTFWNNANNYEYAELRIASRCYNVMRISNGFCDIAFA